jgi:membrane protein YdbS with pleckstrin-like domain
MTLFKPSPRYLTRLRIEISLLAFILLSLGILSAGLVSMNANHNRQATQILQGVILFDLILYLLALKLVRSVYQSRIYEFNEDEIIVHSGWWTQSVRHVPLSSVVGFEMRWDRLDRWLEIGTLDVQIATWRDVKGSRVRLAGLADVQAVAQRGTRLLKHLRDERLAAMVMPAGSPNASKFNVYHQNELEMRR